jgi:hypothetical protein
MPDEDSPATPASQEGSAAVLITRSDVPVLDNYSDYKKYLRYDFWYSCAYCTMTEAEAQSISFTIDHYEPRGARPDLEHTYTNLMYCCDACNKRKGNRCPPDEAREAGLRFFRPDEDVYADHFELNGLLLAGKTPAGSYTIEAVDLNRASVRRLRQLRERLAKNSEYIASGIAGLRQAKIDKLPPTLRARIHYFRTNLEKAVERFEKDIDALLREHAKSELLDLPEDKRQQTDRLESLKQTHALFPGEWRAAKKAKA